MAHRFLLTKAIAISKRCGNQGKQDLKKDMSANYCYETEENLPVSVRRYLRRTGCWSKI
jgi:hypothetical protein